MGWGEVIKYNQPRGSVFGTPFSDNHFPNSASGREVFDCRFKGGE